MLLKGLDDPETCSGCFVSPLSMYLALSVTLSAAGDGSASHDELLRLLGTSSIGAAPQAGGMLSEHEVIAQVQQLAGLVLATSTAPAGQLILANSLWTRDASIKKAYAEQMFKLFRYL